MARKKRNTKKSDLPYSDDPDATKFWGLRDFQERVWLGTDRGPLTFDRQDHAIAASRVLLGTLEWPATRVMPAGYWQGSTTVQDIQELGVPLKGTLRKVETAIRRIR